LEHHKSYVEGLNNAELELEKARVNGDFSLVKHWERELAFHGSGHYLHAMFWENMMPNGGIIPQGEILNDINKSFGSFDKFKKHFTEAALKVEGVGWAILVWSPRSRRLEILQTEKQQLFTQWDTIPLLGLDVWEHAYYLQYKANRKEYINNWWNIVNWSNVNDRLVVAKNIKWNAV
jgi:Fe-Mn family superoxide dismutase